jgi:tetratricopeptide (TPR) repeat protein
VPRRSDHNRGNALQDLKRLDDALAAYARALALNPGKVSILRQLAGVLSELDRDDEARGHLDAALRIDANDAETLRAIGIHCIHQEIWHEAETWLRRALAVRPEAASNLRALGGVLDELKRYDEAWTCLESALRIDAGDADTLQAIGSHTARQERWEEAEAWVRRALAIKPEQVGSLNDLTVIQLARNDLGSACATAMRSFRLEASDEAKKAFVYAASKLRPIAFDPSLPAMVCDALREPWERPYELMGLACHLLKQDPKLQPLLQTARLADGAMSYDRETWETIAGDGLQNGSLLAVTLASAPIPDSELEEFFTWVRHLLLNEATRTQPEFGESTPALDCYAALAQQCFINEYVFFETPAEIQQATNLRGQLTKAIEDGEKIPDIWLMAVAFYAPLHTVVGSEKLLQREWAAATNAVLVQQIREPLEERRLRASIPCLTAIEMWFLRRSRPSMRKIPTHDG